MNPIIDDSLPLAMSELLGSVDLAREERAVEVLSCLITHGAGPTPRQLSLVGAKAGFKAARKCFLDAVCSAINPLLVGMRLSLLLADAAGMGNEGQRRVRHHWCYFASAVLMLLLMGIGSRFCCESLYTTQLYHLFSLLQLLSTLKQSLRLQDVGPHPCRWLSWLQTASR